MLKELEGLNPSQRKAAENFYGSMLILAGAGSGKTKTIVTRVANMIYNGIPGNKMLIMTFTNKAAKEMKERGMKMLNGINLEYQSPTFTTFHGWCFGFIREYIYLAGEGLTASSQVADESTTKAIMKNIQGSEAFQKFVKKETGEWTTEMKKVKMESFFTTLQNKMCPYKKVEETYNEVCKIAKTYEIQGKEFIDSSDVVMLKYVSIAFLAYKRYLRRNNLMDFDDLINLSIKVIQKNDDIKASLNQRYEYITVDEFQDTNYAQMVLLSLLIGKKENICVVGDDSQSIYGWRGAEIDYILGFSERYKDVKVFNLSINYRSTPNILGIANKLLGFSLEKHDLKETLLPYIENRGKDECVKLYNPTAEAIYVASEIKRSINSGTNPADIAILYRNNDIGKSFEAELIKHRVPYHIFKGRTLLKRKAVSEFMSLLGFLVNKKDQVSLSIYFAACRILSEAKVKKVTDMAFEEGLDFLAVTRREMYDKASKVFSKPNIKALEAFFESVRDFDKLIVKDDTDMEDIVSFIGSRFDLIRTYKKIEETTKSEETASTARSAIKALDTIIGLMCDYPSLEVFLEEMVLSADAKDDTVTGKVNLMTVHASKGLEFDEVYLARFNNSTFPSDRALSNGAKAIEEERRLAYVGITRAKKKLCVSYVQKIYGKMVPPSMFIRETGLDKKRREIFIKLNK